MAVTQSTWPDEAAESPESMDQRIFLHEVPWSHYEILVAVKGDAPVPRIAYLEGELELMSPSKDHETIKSMIGRLIDAYAAHLGIDLRPVGSWTVRNPQVERGIEPDECYTIGSPRTKTVPDLAIEVAWTRGGIDKLSIYRGLGVREVWTWRSGRIEVRVLTDGEYQLRDASTVLPNIDLAVLARIAMMDISLADALSEFRRSWT